MQRTCRYSQLKYPHCCGLTFTPEVHWPLGCSVCGSLAGLQLERVQGQAWILEFLVQKRLEAISCSGRDSTLAYPLTSRCTPLLPAQGTAALSRDGDWGDWPFLPHRACFRFENRSRIEPVTWGQRQQGLPGGGERGEGGGLHKAPYTVTVAKPLPFFREWPQPLPSHHKP